MLGDEFALLFRRERDHAEPLWGAFEDTLEGQG